MFLKNHFQNAFITHDVRKAAALIDQKFGVGEWEMFDPQLVMQTPFGPRDMATSVALGWRGEVQIELIQPVSGYVDPFLTVLPEDNSDFIPRFHHVAVRRDDLAAMRAEIAKLDLPLVFESAMKGVTFIYLDARATLGHYLEFACSSEEAWSSRGWPKSKTVAA